MLIIGMPAVAAGGIVVLAVIGRIGASAPPIAMLDAAVPAKPALSVTPQLAAVDASSTAPIPIPQPAAHGVATTHKIPASTRAGACLCHPNSGMTSSLCAKDQLGPSSSRCESVINNGMTLCPVPWALPDGCPTSSKYGGTPTAKDGDACTGFNGGAMKDGSYSNGKLEGRLS